MAFHAARSVIMQSVRRQRSSLRSPSKLPVKSPRKSPTKTQRKKATIRTPSPTKTTRNSKDVKKSQSDSGLSSSFRRLSITPKPPNSRPNNVLSRKFHSSIKRGLTTFTASSIEDVAFLIREEKFKNVIVMAGAGISCPSGIPDFRTPGTGLYDNLQEYNIPEPTAIFDIDYFWYNPKPFFSLAQTLYPGNFQPNLAHYFVKLLHDKGLLLRMYTQNIDGLERLAGIPSEKLVEAHGTFSSASCIRCHKSFDGEDIKKTILNGDIPRCTAVRCKGIVKPNIVFFGEDLPKRFFYYLKDFPKCDLLFIMGTSLEVQPFAGIVSETKRSTPRVLINKDVVGPFARSWQRRPNDVIIRGDVVERLTDLIKLLGWEETTKTLLDKANREWKEKYGEQKKVSSTSVSENPTDESRGAVNGKSSGEKGGPSKNGGRKSYHTLAGVRNVFNAHASKYVVSPCESEKTAPLFTDNDKKPFSSSRTSFVGMFTLPEYGMVANNNSSPISTKFPPLSLKYNHPKEPEISVSNESFRAIDPNKDLASAGFGLGRRTRTKRGSLRCFLSHESESDSDSSDYECSVR